MRFLFLCLSLLYFGQVQAQESGFYGVLTGGTNQQQGMVAATADTIVYHTYQVDVPAGISQLILSITGNGHDFDLAAKAGSEMLDYETDVDALDFSEAPNPILTIENPTAGSWFVDVVNVYEVSALYQIQIELHLTSEATAAQAAPLPSETTQNNSATPLVASGDGISMADTWEYNAEDSYGFSVTTYSLSFLPEGLYRYFEQPDYSETATVIEEGRYRFDGGRLHLEPWCGSPESFEARQQGDDLLTIFADSTMRTWGYIANSNVTTPEELRSLYKGIEQESVAFLVRTPLAPLTSRISPLEPGITDHADPNSQHIFAGAIVFAEHELYNYFSDYYWYRRLDGAMSLTSLSSCILNPSGCEMFRDFSHSTYRDQLIYLFFPNGRFFYKSILYGTSVDTSTNPVAPSVESTWGRYSIVNDQIQLDSPLNSRTATLLNGRRYLSGEICVPEVESDTERLQAQ